MKSLPDEQSRSLWVESKFCMKFDITNQHYPLLKSLSSVTEFKKMNSFCLMQTSNILCSISKGGGGRITGEKGNIYMVSLSLIFYVPLRKFVLKIPDTHCTIWLIPKAKILLFKSIFMSSGDQSCLAGMIKRNVKQVVWLY